MVAGSYELIVAGDTYQRAVAILSQAGEPPATADRRRSQLAYR
jgi:hypothetical protein